MVLDEKQSFDFFCNLDIFNLRVSIDLYNVDELYSLFFVKMFMYFIIFFCINCLLLFIYFIEVIIILMEVVVMVKLGLEIIVQVKKNNEYFI